MLDSDDLVPESCDQQSARAAAGIILEPRHPLEWAKQCVSLNFTKNGRPTLKHYQGDFYEYPGICWERKEEAAIRAFVWEWQGKAITNDDPPRPFRSSSPSVSGQIDAMKGITYHPSTVPPPAWLDGRKGPDPKNLVVCQNGILNLPTKKLSGHTPALFTHNAMPFAYDPNAKPVRWLEFLSRVWPDDWQSIETLQEWFGYCLTPRTNLQKMLIIIGPTRSGKGTIGRMQTAVLGQMNVVGLALGSLATNFGLQPLIGKLLAIISDARIGNRADLHLILERMLSIVGEDPVTIDRKFGEPWSGRANARFMMLANELPRLPDSSGALAARAIVLSMTESFKGKEDPRLTDALMEELPGIFAWAVEGWHRLMERGHFIQPESGSELLRELEDLGSPISVFLREKCDVGPAHEAKCEDVYHAWVSWCDHNGHGSGGNIQAFGRTLRSALPSLRVIQPRPGDGGSRVRKYQGIAVKLV